MDLTIKMGEYTLNVRVAVIMETGNGFVFEKNKNGYYFFLGGRVKIGENSLEACKREVFEETKLEIGEEKFKFISTVENFFDTPEGKVHEICFVYVCENVENISPEFGLVEFKKEEIENTDIRPEIIKRLILENNLENITHFIV